MTAADPPETPLTIQSFGPLEVRVNGAPLPRLRSRKGLWLLALLALRQGQAVERDWLAGLLWPENSQSDALYNLRRNLASLRRALGAEAGRLCSPTPHTLRLDLAGTEVDIAAFDAAIATGDAASLQRAVALYRGPLLEGCVEEWAFQERQARESAYLAALETLAGQARESGDLGAAERYLRRVVAVDPQRETAHRALMQALAMAGNYAAALTAYRDLRLWLHQELNAEPDPETQALFQQLRIEARAKSHGGTGRQGDGTTRQCPPSGRPVPLSPRPPLSASLPEGTVTFLFTDIEGSTRRWEQDPDAMRDALARHDRLLDRVIQADGGQVFKRMGDQCCAAFSSAPEALAAALAAQEALAAEPWGQERSDAWGGPLRVRMALHTGTVTAQEGDYFGPTLNRVARLLEAGHGGQILLSLPTEELVRDELPEGASLRPLGEHRLKDLARAERVFQLLHPDLPSAFPPLRSLGVFTHNLPLQWTSFIGREQETAALKPLLAATPLLTLTGPGGCGKSRLALQVAADLLDDYPDGVWLVELAALADPALVPQTMAAALGVPEWPGRPLTTTLVDHLRARSLLLVLDNCEHLLAACAQLVEALLRSCPNVRVMATSRERLGITGERVYTVPSLSLPPVHEEVRSESTSAALLHSEAVRLFVERAVYVQPQFALTEGNAGAVAQLCHRLDGIPLALELAAARVKALPVEQIHARLDDMFRLLTGGSRTALPRQQTLRALIDWSYDLLSEPERALLRRLSVFAGGWTLEAAEAVGVEEGVEEWEVLDRLTSLVEKSLVLYEEQGGEGRYRLLETVRQYAHDRLQEGGEAEAVRGRHAAYFLQLAERGEPELRGPEQVLWSERLDLEHDNLRAALTWFGSVEERAEAHSRLTSALWLFWNRRGYFREGRRWTEEALSRGRHAPAPVRAKLLSAAGRAAYSMGDYTAADALFEESVALARAAGQQWVAAFSLFHWALLAISQREYARAMARAQESLTLAREVDDPWLRALPLVALGRAALHQGDAVAARPFLEESLAVSLSTGDRFLIARATAHLGAVALSLGECEPAGGLYREALMRSQEVADERAIAGALCGLAVVAVPEQPERAARLFGAAEVLREALGSPYLAQMIDPVGYDHHVAALRGQLGEDAFAAAWAEGRAMPPEQAVTYALESDAAATGDGQ